MRLIDADKFKRENERMLNCDFPYISEETLGELIDKAPTIEAVPMDFRDRCMEIEIEKRFAIEKHGQWIPCSERLPDKKGIYLCTVGADYRNPREMIYEPDDFCNDDSNAWMSIDGYRVMNWFVIAWTPMPKPYKMNEVSE